jgi:hypothetical protein
MTTSQPHPLLPLPLPPCWDSLPPLRRRKLLALLGAMVRATLRASPHREEVNDEPRPR